MKKNKNNDFDKCFVKCLISLTVALVQWIHYSSPFSNFEQQIFFFIFPCILCFEFLFLRSQKARNMTEKRRRDKLNMYINQLAALLPPEGHRKMDKSSVLEQGVNYLNLCCSKF